MMPAALLWVEASEQPHFKIKLQTKTSSGEAT
jgi:hypothetical protein